ncbi:hypothetical protein [Candidatus Ferrigenium straubiae]|jgi:NTP pyrophosphatase (non-canonical NTP hydrolase)|uniref:hypothetical protein n=1 Tax=Candidatus Ferrigenium straubiae TaxID=2919506 RepID=UPI003F4A86FD
MNRKEYLLTCLAEECAEVAQACSKALRFGLDDKRPNHTLTNAQYISAEINDVIALVKMLEEEGLLPRQNSFREIEAKKAKMEHFMEYAKQRGTLTV